MTDKTKLFQDFNPVSAREWKQKIQADLKGLDYNETLLTLLADGLIIKPFYNREDMEGLTPFSSYNSFKISENIEIENESKANKWAKNAIDKGVEAIFFQIVDPNTDLSGLIEGIDAEVVEIHLILHVLDDSVLRNLNKLESVYVHLDIISNLARTGNWFHSLKEGHQLLEDLVASAKNLNSILSVDTSLYQNAGASHVQQIAYGMAHALEYLNHFEGSYKGPMHFLVSVGSNYFLEIAKLRALRWLYTSIKDEFELAGDCRIIAFPSNRNKAIYDYNTNLLRTTSECMSAVLGGADTVVNHPYDHVYKNSHDFSSRIARNQLHLMRHEAYLDSVSNPVDGTYFIESLTNDLAEKALTLVKDIDRNGGFLSQLKAGTIQRKIKEKAQAEQHDFDKGELKILGTNFQQNSEDNMKDEIEKNPFVKFEKRKTLIEPIIERRLSEFLDKERINTEN